MKRTAHSVRHCDGERFIHAAMHKMIQQFIDTCINFLSFPSLSLLSRLTRSRLGFVFSMSAAAGGAAGTAKLCYIRYHRKLELRERPAIVASCVVSRLADGRRCCKRSKGRTSLNGIALATNPVSTPWPLLRPGFWPSKWSGLAVLIGLDVSHVFDTPLPTY